MYTERGHQRRILERRSYRPPARSYKRAVIKGTITEGGSREESTGSGCKGETCGAGSEGTGWEEMSMCVHGMIKGVHQKGTIFVAQSVILQQCITYTQYPSSLKNQMLAILAQYLHSFQLGPLEPMPPLFNLK